jgi:hypothetical protein
MPYYLLFQYRIFYMCVACTGRIFLVDLFGMVEFLVLDVHVCVDAKGPGTTRPVGWYSKIGEGGQRSDKNRARTAAHKCNTE